MKSPCKHTVWLAAAFLASSAWLSACSTKGPADAAGVSSASARSSGGETIAGTPSQFYVPKNAVFDVKYTANTIRVDLPTAQKAIRSVSQDGQVLIFDASDPRLAALKQGDVLLLEHVGVRRILAVEKQAAQIAVATDSVGLPDFIQDGNIEFSAPVDFHAQSARVNPLSDLWDMIGLQSVVYAQDECGNPKEARGGLQFKGEADEWEFEVEGEPEGNNLLLCLKAAKKLNLLTASVKIKGELENVNTAFKAAIHGGKVSDFEYSSPIEGKITATWAALTMGAGAGIGESRLKAPPWWKQVIDVDGIPFLLQVNGNVIFKPGFGGAHDAAEGGFEVDYNGSGGLNIHGEQSSPEGQMSGEPNLEKTTAESMAAHGVILAIAAPKVALSVGTESFKEALEQVTPHGFLDKAAEALEQGPFASLFKTAKENFFNVEGAAYVQLVTEFDYAGSGPLSIVPCTMTHLNLTGQAGADATLLALKMESPHVDLFKVSKVNREPDIDACGQK